MRIAFAYLFILLILLTYGTYRYNIKQSNNRPLLQKTGWKQTIYAKKVSPRLLRLSRFFTSYNSPLAFESESFLEASEKYKIDYKILVAIAGVESTFAKNIAYNSHNPFGYMCGNRVCYFKSYRQAIFKVAQTISRNRAYKKYRLTKRIIDLAEVYNYVYPEEWSSKLEWFIKKI